MKKDITGVYHHYKGNEYRVIGEAVHTETEERLVVYAPLYDSNYLADKCESRPAYFVRSYDVFFEKVEVDGKIIDRFEKLSDKNNQKRSFVMREIKMKLKLNEGCSYDQLKAKLKPLLVGEVDEKRQIDTIF